MSGARAVGTRTRAVARGVLVLLAVLAAGVVQQVGIPERIFHPQTRFALDEAREVSPELRVEFRTPSLGSAWQLDGGGSSGRTAEVFLVVPMRMELRDRRAAGLRVELHGGDGRTYSSVDARVPTPDPWTRCRDAAVFLVPWEALEGSRLDFREADRAEFYGPGGVVPLGLTADRLAQLEPMRDQVVDVESCSATREVL